MMYVVSQPDPDFAGRAYEDLWLLTDIRGDLEEQATAYHLGVDRAGGEDFALAQLREIAQEYGLDLAEAEAALARYRLLVN